MKRQGDILLVPVERLPDGLHEVPREDGKIVLAEGEATGHLHMIDSEEATFLAEDIAKIEHRFLKVEEEVATEHEVPIFETKIVGHYTEEEARQIGSPNEVMAGDPITETVQVGTRMVRGVALTHPEHDTVVLEPGNYEVRRQRGYDQAGGIELVAD